MSEQNQDKKDKPRDLDTKNDPKGGGGLKPVSGGGGGGATVQPIPSPGH